MKRLLYVFVLVCLMMTSLVSVDLGTVYGEEGDEEPIATQSYFSNPIYIPMILSLGSDYSIAGRVLDENGLPVPSVAIVDQAGKQAYTNADGNYVFTGIPAGSYALAPEMSGFVFSPAVVDVNVPPHMDNQNFTALIDCDNELRNWSFENNNGWVIPPTEYSARYTTELVHSGLRSMRTGIVDSGDNRWSYSDAYQLVEIPSKATEVTFRMWEYPRSTPNNLLEPLPEPPIGKQLSALSAETLSGDVQYVLILDQYGTIIEAPLWRRSDTREWVYHEFNLKKYAGDTIRIQFGTYNTGSGGVTAMYVDDVALEPCAGTPPTPTPTPTPGPSPTPSPTPTGCTERIDNNSFETDDDWYIPITEFTADYSDDKAHTGSWSMRTGIVHQAHNRYSYSDAGQEVTIPGNAKDVTLSLWVYPLSGEAASMPLPAIQEGIEFREASLSNDVQYVLILDRYGYWIDTLLWQRSDAGTWKSYSYNLDRYAGDTIRIQFGTYNDGWGGVTAMYVDDVSLQACP